jgi:hypothetical protein
MGEMAEWINQDDPDEDCDQWIDHRERGEMNFMEKLIMENLRKRLRNLAVALRDLSPGPHSKPMDAEEYIPLIKAALERKHDRQI